jgi:hypothetical protein
MELTQYKPLGPRIYWAGGFFCYVLSSPGCRGRFKMVHWDIANVPGVSWLWSGTCHFWADIGWEQWGTHRGEQEGDPPWRIERGRGKTFPACEPDRVTVEGILSEEMIGFDVRNSSLEEKLMGPPKTIHISEETPRILLCRDKPFWEGHGNWVIEGHMTKRNSLAQWVTRSYWAKQIIILF